VIDAPYASRSFRSAFAAYEFKIRPGRRAGHAPPACSACGSDACDRPRWVEIRGSSANQHGQPGQVFCRPQICPAGCLSIIAPPVADRDDSPSTNRRSIMKKLALIIVSFALVLLWFTGVGLAADMVTIQGQVTEDNQLMDAEGNVFDIADTDKGNEVLSIVGEKVEVRGTLVEGQGMKEITVESYRIIEE
jgi:hypothetical protein